MTERVPGTAHKTIGNCQRRDPTMKLNYTRALTVLCWRFYTLRFLQFTPHYKQPGQIMYKEVVNDCIMYKANYERVYFYRQCDSFQSQIFTDFSIENVFAIVLTLLCMSRFLQKTPTCVRCAFTSNVF